MTDPNSSKRKTLKKLAVSTASIAAGVPFTNAFAQTDSESLPAIVDLLLDEPAPESFTLLEDNYTGMAIQSFQVNANARTYILSATANLSLEVISSELNETRVNIDMIVLLEGLRDIDPSNSNIAIEYIFRNGSNALLDKPIVPGQANAVTGVVTGGGSEGNSCGYFEQFPLEIRIENFQPIVRVLEQNFTQNGVEVSLPSFQVVLEAGDSAIPADRTNQNCRDPLFIGSETTIPVGTTLAPL